MKRKLVWIGIFAAILGLLALLLLLSIRPTPAASLVFVGFTNDLDGLRTSRYRLADDSPRSLALFHLTNHTSLSLHYFEGPIEHQTPTGWTFDTNELFIGMTTPKTLSGRGQSVVWAPRPVGTSIWHLNIQLSGLPTPPPWIVQVNSVLKRIGLAIPTKGYTILTVTSEGIAPPE
jgi:hypothetical protein